MDDDIFCPHCKTSKYRNPSLKLYVNVCGHPLCENCLDLLFLKGTGNCTQCGLLLRRNNFRLRLFEDDLVEKEIDIRKRILRDFNKKEDDFETLLEYDNYLEQIETIIYNLTNNIDVDATKRLVEDYKKKNAEVSIKNCGKLSKDDILLDQLLEEEKEKEDLKKKWQQAEESNVKFNQMKKLEKEALVDQLMNSNMSATQILESHVNNLKSKEQQQKLFNDRQQDQMKQKLFEQETQASRNKPSYFSTGIQRGKASNIFAPVPKDESKPYVYEARELPLNGPKLPSIKDLVNKKYLNNVRSTDEIERAGGFEPYYSCCRALLDAFCGLYFDNN